MDQTEQLLKKLTEAHGVPGYESEIRALLHKEMGAFGTLTQDKLGSVICRKRGSEDAPKVMIAGHMDEIGFMISRITKQGFLRFQQLGGWWDQVLLGHRVIIKTRHKGDVIGVIGAKPPHILPPEERNKIVVKKDMYIDIGATSKEDVEAAGIKIGDPVVPMSDFVQLNNNKTYLSKAFDNRVGCALVIDSLRHFQNETHPNTIYGVQTVMEEVGVRGATTSVRAVDPDVAIILEADIAGDVPGILEDESCVKLGQGPSMLTFDARMIPNIPLRNLVMDTAESLGISLQLSVMPGGATDGAAIHMHHIGVPTIVLAVPARHIHSHGAIIHRDDYDNALKLVTAVVAQLNSDLVASFTH